MNNDLRWCVIITVQVLEFLCVISFRQWKRAALAAASSALLQRVQIQQLCEDLPDQLLPQPLCGGPWQLPGFRDQPGLRNAEPRWELLPGAGSKRLLWRTTQTKDCIQVTETMCLHCADDLSQNGGFSHSDTHKGGSPRTLSFRVKFFVSVCLRVSVRAFTQLFDVEFSPPLYTDTYLSLPFVTEAGEWSAQDFHQLSQITDNMSI